MARVQLILFSLTVMSLVFSVVSGEGSAYVVHQLTGCVPFKSKVCPDNTLVPAVADPKEYTSTFEDLASALKKLVDAKTINQTCRDSIEKTVCLGIPSCTTQKINVTAVVASCENAWTDCPNAVATHMLNCTFMKETYHEANKALSIECKEVKDSTGTCPVEHKVRSIVLLNAGYGCWLVRCVRAAPPKVRHTNTVLTGWNVVFRHLGDFLLRCRQAENIVFRCGHVDRLENVLFRCQRFQRCIWMCRN